MTWDDYLTWVSQPITMYSCKVYVHEMTVHFNSLCWFEAEERTHEGILPTSTVVASVILVTLSVAALTGLAIYCKHVRRVTQPRQWQPTGVLSVCYLQLDTGDVSWLTVCVVITLQVYWRSRIVLITSLCSFHRHKVSALFFFSFLVLLHSLAALFSNAYVFLSLTGGLTENIVYHVWLDAVFLVN